MTKLTILADIKVKAGKTELMIDALRKLIAISRTEEGCLQYDMHQDNENPDHLMFYENWSSKELWLKHMEAPHLAAHNEITKDWVEDLTLYEMTHIE